MRNGTETTAAETVANGDPDGGLDGAMPKHAVRERGQNERGGVW